MAETVGCARPTGATVSGRRPEKSEEPKITDKGVSMVEAFVGKGAPDFAAPSYHKGEFTSIKLSDYLGKWVMLCFYPGDFTFV